jgi:outer membrane protein assembly factor BamB
MFPVQNHPVAALGRVFFADTNGNIYSFSQTCRSDGGVCTRQWTTNIGTAVDAGLTFYNGTLYAPTADGSVHTLNATTGVEGTPFSISGTTTGAVTTPLSLDTDLAAGYATGTVLHYRYPGGNSYGAADYGATVSPVALNNGAAFFTTIAFDFRRPWFQYDRVPK